MISTVLSVQNLTKKFYQKKYFWQFYKNNQYKTIIDNITFDLKEGEILGLIGPNGAGKTTIIQMLLNVLTPSSGKIKYFSKELTRSRSKILKYISFASNYINLPHKLTIEESMDIYLKLYNINTEIRAQKLDEYLKIFNLFYYKKKKISILSSGQILKLMIIKAFITEPKIVILDEPTAALDPDSAQLIRSFILQKQKEENISIILTSHNMEEISQMCQRVLVLKKGKIIANESPENLINAQDLNLSLIKDNLENTKKIEEIALKNNFDYQIKNQQIVLKVKKSKLNQAINDLERFNINYCDLNINKPTLNDYFLSLQ